MTFHKEDNSIQCSNCKGDRFHIDLLENRYVCADCGRFLSAHTVAENTDEPQTIYKLRPTNFVAALLFLISLIRILLGLLETLPQPQMVVAFTNRDTTVGLEENVTYEGKIEDNNTLFYYTTPGYVQLGTLDKNVKSEETLIADFFRPGQQLYSNRVSQGNATEYSMNVLLGKVDFGMTDVCDAEMLTSFRKRVLLRMEKA